MEVVLRCVITGTFEKQLFSKSSYHKRADTKIWSSDLCLKYHSWIMKNKWVLFRKLNNIRLPNLVKWFSKILVTCVPNTSKMGQPLALKQISQKNKTKQKIKIWRCAMCQCFKIEDFSSCSNVVARLSTPIRNTKTFGPVPAESYLANRYSLPFACVKWVNRQLTISTDNY